MTKLDAALKLAERGFRVFPLLPNSKLPALQGDWREHATCDPAKIRALWESNDYNIGIWTKGFLILDFDTKRDGLKDFDALVDKGLNTDAMVRTQSGGLHVYLRLPPNTEVANSVGKIGKGVDVRGGNGYVVAPGSIIDGKAYEWI